MLALLFTLYIILRAVMLTLASFLHHTTTVRKDGQTQADPAQERGKHPRLPVEIVAAIAAEVYLSIDQTFYFWESIMYNYNLWRIMAINCKLIK